MVHSRNSVLPPDTDKTTIINKTFRALALEFEAPLLFVAGYCAPTPYSISLEVVSISLTLFCLCHIRERHAVSGKFNDQGKMKLNPLHTSMRGRRFIRLAEETLHACHYRLQPQTARVQSRAEQF